MYRAIVFIVAVVAWGVNGLETCTNCDACEDSSDNCKDSALQPGGSMELCSNVAVDGEKEVSGDIEIASVRHILDDKRSCGKFSLKYYLDNVENDANKDYPGKKEVMCEESGQIFADSAGKQVCMRITCDADNEYDCDLRYQTSWTRTEADVARAVGAAIAIIVCWVCYGVFFVSRAWVFYCCCLTRYMNGTLSATPACPDCPCCTLKCLVYICFFDVMFVLYIVQQCGCAKCCCPSLLPPDAIESKAASNYAETPAATEGQKQEPVGAAAQVVGSGLSGLGGMLKGAGEKLQGKPKA